MHVNAPQVVSRHNGNQVMFERDLYYVFNGPFAVTFCLLMKTAMHAGRVVSVIGQAKWPQRSEHFAWSTIRAFSQGFH